MTKEIISISLGSPSLDCAYTTRMLGAGFRVRQMGTDGDLDRARELVAQFDGTVDAIAIGGMRFQFEVADTRLMNQQFQQLAKSALTTPVVDGAHLKNTLERWSIAQVARQDPGILAHKRILVVSGLDQYGAAAVLSSYTDRIRFGDPLLHLGLPLTLRSLRQLNLYARLVLPAMKCRAPHARFGLACGGEDRQSRRGARLFESVDVIVGDVATILRLGPDKMPGIVVIGDDVSANDVEALRQRGVESLITNMQPLSDTYPFPGIHVVEAIFASLLVRRAHDLTPDNYLELIERSGLEPQVTVLNEPPDVARFAFVIHPLAVQHIFGHPQLKILRFLPHRIVEWVMAQIRPLYVSRIRGVRSEASGKEVEGFLITLGATPRELMRRRPGFTYRRLIVASRMAQQMGAQIMGLGAFTKVVGDAGMTVAYKSDIAITSGNSLTVAATLEAAKQAVLQIGGRIDQGRAVVIGATGSIGSVCSRLLAQAIHDVVLVAPRPEKLIPLKRIIEAETPGARVTMATSAGRHLSEADLVVTTTTAIGQKVIDVTKLKPGCVVCDVARPPDVHEEDARLRPDVLVIESGEILLPGKPDFGFNIGLPPGVAYACLAEAALLAMEGRFESFTLGRNIEMEKVKEIYRLFKKHGLQLEGLRSFGRYVTAEHIARKRALADELRAHPEKLEALVAARGSEAGQVPGASRSLGRAKPWLAAAGGIAALATGWLLSRLKRGGRG